MVTNDKSYWREVKIVPQDLCRQGATRLEGRDKTSQDISRHRLTSQISPSENFGDPLRKEPRDQD